MTFIRLSCINWPHEHLTSHYRIIISTTRQLCICGLRLGPSGGKVTRMKAYFRALDSSLCYLFMFYHQWIGSKHNLVRAAPSIGLNWTADICGSAQVFSSREDWTGEASDIIWHPNMLNDFWVGGLIKNTFTIEKWMHCHGSDRMFEAGQVSLLFW